VRVRLAQDVSRVHAELARAALGQALLPEVARLGSLAAQRDARLRDVETSLADAREDLTAARAAIRTETARGDAAMSRQGELEANAEAARRAAGIAERRFAAALHQYVSETQHRADLQAEVDRLQESERASRARRREVEARLVEARQELTEAKEVADRSETRCDAAERRVAELVGALASAETRAAEAEAAAARDAWRQKATMNRFKNESAAATNAATRAADAETRAADAAGELDRLRAALADTEARLKDAAASLSETRAARERLEFDAAIALKAVDRLNAECRKAREELERKRVCGLLSVC